MLLIEFTHGINQLPATNDYQCLARRLGSQPLIDSGCQMLTQKHAASNLDNPPHRQVSLIFGGFESRYSVGRCGSCNLGSKMVCQV